jgi:hypothetical protein
MTAPVFVTELDATTVAWVQAAKAASDEIHRLTEIRDRAADHIKAALGDAESATIGGRPAVTWAWSKPGQRLDRNALLNDHGPEFVARYLVDNVPARPFKLLGDDA